MLVAAVTSTVAEGPPRGDQLPEESAPPGQTRPRPQYDPREVELDAAEVLSWAPRVILYPLHLVLEYALRRPIVTAITGAEEAHLFERVEDLVTWREGRSAVFPTFFADFGMHPSVGIATFHREFPAENNELSGSIGFWDDHWIKISARNRTRFLANESGELSLRASFETRPDRPFYGIGPRTADGDRLDYRDRRAEGCAQLSAQLGGRHRISLQSAIRNVDVLDDRDGLAGEYRLVDHGLELILDTRADDIQLYGGTGLRLRTFGRFLFDPREPSRNFARFGAEAAVFWDLTGRGHVLGARVYGELAERWSDHPIPFTELPALGGDVEMRGFLERRFIGDSVLDGTLSYRYPIWSLLDAELFAGLGNAYDEHWRSFALKRTYLSGGVALHTNSTLGVELAALFGAGTNRLDSERIELQSVRFAFGLMTGF